MPAKPTTSSTESFQKNAKYPELDVYQGRKKAAPKPPLLSKYPGIGCLPEILKDPIGLALHGYRNLGPVFRLDLMAGKPIVFAGPEAMRFVIKHEREYFSAQGQLDHAARIFGTTPDSMMVNVDGERHRQLRADQKPAMSRGYMEKKLDGVIDMTDQYLDEIAGQNELEITSFSKRLIFRQLGKTMIDDYEPDLFDDARAIMDTLVNTVSKPWTNYLPFHSKAKRAMVAFRQYSKRLESRFGDVDPEKTDLNFAETVFAGVKKGFYPEKDIPILISAPYIAGLDTAAHALAFALYGLLIHPEALAEVQQEITATLGNEPLTAQQLKSMNCVKGTVMESMRMYSITFLQSRTAACDFVVNGTQINKGDRVLFAPTVAHRMPEYFPYPERFDIHRFDKDRREHGIPGVFQPYGAGVHICLGAGVADALIAVNLVKIFRDYEIEIRPKNYKLKVKNIPAPAPVGLKIKLSEKRQRFKFAA